MRFAAAVCLSGVLVSAWLEARQETAPPVNVRLIATDGTGKSAALSPGDVTLTVGAQPQPLLSFRRVSAAPRTLGILLDEYHVTPGPSTEHVRAALRDFVSAHVRADDAVFVAKPLDAPSKIAAVAGRAELETLIGGFAGRKGNYTPQNDFEAEYMSAVPPAAARQRAQVTRAAIQALIVALSRGDGPKAVIVVTEGFGAEERGRDRFVSMRTIAHAARTADVTLYVVDPSPEAPAKSMFGEAWRSLVADTGGLLVEAPLPIEPALARISAELSDHYVATIAAPVKEDGAYHGVAVAVKRPGVAVRAPQGFWARIAAERYSVASRPPMSSYLKTPHISGVIQPSFRMSKAGKGRTRVTFSWMPRGRGGRPANVALSAVTFEGVRLHEARLPPHGADTATRTEFTADPGPLQVALAITDASGTLIDTDVRYIDIPNLESERPIITGIELVRTRSLPEFLRLQTQADVLPAETRHFDRHDRLLVRVRAVAGGGAPPVSVRLLNRLGRTIRDLPALPDVDGVPQFDLPLAPYPSGDYRIQIIVGNGTSTVSQMVTFRLLG
jgi:VWFA-related protein